MSRIKRSAAWLAARPRVIWDTRTALAWATLSGVLTFVSFPAWNLFPLAFIALIPMLRVAEQGTWKRAGWCGLWMGTVTNLGGFYWITNLLEDYGFMPLPLALTLYAMLCVQQGTVWAAAFALGRFFTSRGGPAWLSYPTGLMVAESLIPLIFPWYFGNSQFENYAFIQSAELGGVVLLSGLVAMANVALCQIAAAVRHGQRPARASLAVIGVVVLNFAYGAVRIPQVDARAAAADTIAVGLVQANVGIYEKGDRRLLGEQLLRHQRLSADLEAQGAELIVWPETAFEPPTYVFEQDGSLRASVYLPRDVALIPPSAAPLPASPREDDAQGRQVDERNALHRGFTVPALVGTVMRSQRDDARMAASPPRGGQPWRWDIHNAAILVDGDGHVLGSYDKTERMIFSEYVPGGRWLWSTFGVNLYDMIPAAGDFFPGEPTEGFVLPTEDGDIRIGVMICYEDILPAFGRAIHPGKPAFIVNVTNDAWFGDTSEPALHLALATFRSVEQRTTLVRSTNTGISAFVDPVGRIVAQTPTYEEATLLHETPILPATTTLFMRLGNWPPFAGVAALVAFLAVRRQRGRSRAT